MFTPSGTNRAKPGDRRRIAASLPPLEFKAPHGHHNNTTSHAIDDAGLYPLADMPTPPAVRHFPFDLNGAYCYLEEIDPTIAHATRHLEPPPAAPIHHTQRYQEQQQLQQRQQQPHALLQRQVSPSPSSSAFHVSPQHSPRKRPVSWFLEDESWEERKPKRVDTVLKQSPPALLTPIAEPPSSGFQESPLTVDTTPPLPLAPSSITNTTSTSTPTSTIITTTTTTTTTTATPATPATPATTTPTASVSAAATAAVAVVDAEEDAGSQDPTLPQTAADTPNSALPSPSLSPVIAERKPLPVAKDDPISFYTSLPAKLQDYVMTQLLRRTPMDALRLAHHTINQGLRTDILARLYEEDERVRLNVPDASDMSLVRCVLLHCDVRTLSRAMAVSKTWHALVANDVHLWKCKLQEADYTTDIIEVPDSPNPYKSLYERRHRLRQNWNHNRCTRKQLEGHANNVVTCLQFDDDKIVTGSDDHNVNIYDIKTGKLRRTLEGHEGGVWALQYIDNTLITGSTDRTIRIWDMETGRCRHIFRGHGSTVRCLTIVTPTRTHSGQLEPRRTLLVSGSRDHTVRVWELPSMDNSILDNETRTSEHMYQRHKLIGHEGSVRALAAHGSMLASGSYDNTVRIWNISTGRLQHVLKGHEQKVYTVVIDGERGKCISGSMDTTVRIWDMTSGACERVLQGHHILVGLLGLSPNYLVSAAADQTLRVWSPRTGQCYHTLFGHKAAITSFQHDEHKVISGAEGSLRMWDIKTGKYMHELIGDINGVWRVAFNERWCVAAVRSKEDKTRIEVMDFGAGCF